MMKAVLLDIDDTLLDFDANAKKALELCCRTAGTPFLPEYPALFHKVNDVLWGKVETGEITRAQLYDVRFGHVFAEWGISAAPKPFEEQFRHELCTLAEHMDGAIDLLDYLKGKYLICAASNSAYEQQISRLKTAGMFSYFDKLYISEKVGASKPSEQFFEYCLNDLAPLSKEEIIMIGDSPNADISGAKKMGIPTCWFAHGKRASMPCEADYTVHSLAEIKNVL